MPPEHNGAVDGTRSVVTDDARRALVDGPRDALITGIGLVSSLGDGAAAHWAALDASIGFHTVLDTEQFAPWMVHPMVPLALDSQIPKRGDQRQMEPWQRIGVYAAGRALEAAGVKGDAALLGAMDMIVAAGGGERDYAAETVILSALQGAADPGTLLAFAKAGDRHWQEVRTQDPASAWKRQMAASATAWLDHRRHHPPTR